MVSAAQQLTRSTIWGGKATGAGKVAPGRLQSLRLWHETSVVYRAASVGVWYIRRRVS